MYTVPVEQSIPVHPFLHSQIPFCWHVPRPPHPAGHNPAIQISNYSVFTENIVTSSLLLTPSNIVLGSLDPKLLAHQLLNSFTQFKLVIQDDDVCHVMACPIRA